jgi:NADPH:quinone reductase-like Zn-dependent oxidoreductase
MRAVSVSGAFGLAHVACADVARPRPADDEVLLRVRAASLNYRDVMVADGRYNPRFRVPLILGSDCVGEVVELGAAVDARAVPLGARACPLVVRGWLSGHPKRSATQTTLGGPLPGVFAEYVAVRSDSLVLVPEYLSDLEAACLPCAALTAYSALVTLSPLMAGATLLTLGGGGVSLFALQIAKLLGARVIATSRAEEKRARLLALGADAVLDASSPGWGLLARKFADGEGVDHVIEVSGGPSLGESLSAVRPGGTVSLIGVLGGSQTSLDLLPIVMRNVRVQGVFVGHAESFQGLMSACAKAELHPVIDSVFELERAEQAFERLASGQHFGKVCLKL